MKAAHAKVAGSKRFCDVLRDVAESIFETLRRWEKVFKHASRNGSRVIQATERSTTGAEGNGKAEARKGGIETCPQTGETESCGEASADGIQSRPCLANFATNHVNHAQLAPTSRPV